MEEKIVIIGNGFDLRHFLPTKYNHLITILREIELLNFKNIEDISFDVLFGKMFKERDDWFYEEICNHYNTDQIVFKKDDLISIQERLKNNNWFQYLKSVEDSKIETWIDFETEIERVLKIILRYFNNFNNDIFDEQFKTRSRGSTRLHFDYFDNRLNSKLFNNNLQFTILKNFNLFEILNDNFLYKCNEKYTLVVDNQLQYFKEKNFFDLIYYSLEEFAGIFNDYIENVVNLFYLNFKNDKKENFITKNNKFLFGSVEKILSFNYTNTYNEFYTNILLESARYIQGKNRKIEFVHGYSVEDWNEDLEKLKIVLGVDEIDDDLKNHKLFQFTKYFQKLHKDTDFLFLNDLIVGIEVNYKTDPLTFYFWGHSLDVSDQEYITQIFEITKKKHYKIIIFYHSISGKADQLKNLLNIIDRNIIENFMKNNILTFLESTPENLFKELSEE